MNLYDNFKKKNRVSDMSREELFDAAYKLGQEGDSTKAKAAEEAFRGITDILMSAFKSGNGLNHDEVSKMLSKIKTYDYRLITCSYCYRYVK